MIDKEKVIAEIERFMYAYNLEADIAASEDAIEEKIAQEKYELCKRILSFVNNLEVKEMQEEPVSEDLEEAAIQYAKLKHKDATLQKIVSWDFKAGAQWKKEQMMKGAIEAYIRRNKYTKKNVLNGLDVTCDAIQKFNGGDKVKVIVIKED